MDAFSENNHLKYGFTEFFLEYLPNSVFHIGLGELLENPQSLRVECENACKDIYLRAEGKKIYVALSGGVDSECVLRSFIGAKVPVQAAILRFNDDLNWHDVDDAFKLCEELGVKYTIVELNLLDFYSKDIHLGYAKQFQLSSPMIATHLFLAEKILQDLDGVPIFSGDVARLAIKNNQPILNLEEELEEVVNHYVVSPAIWSWPSFLQQDHLVLDQIFHKKKQFGVSNFYFYSPSQVAASIEIGLRAEYLELESELNSKMGLLENGADTFYQGQINLTFTKEMLFHLGGFSPNKHISKWTGFELFHSSFANGSFTDGRSIALMQDLQKRIVGMTMFNEKYRKPMKEIAKQIYLKRILLSHSLFQFISALIDSRKG